jgi:hypothetical protein
MTRYELDIRRESQDAAFGLLVLVIIPAEGFRGGP